MDDSVTIPLEDSMVCLLEDTEGDTDLLVPLEDSSVVLLLLGTI